jgi:superfamily II DNA/RNA helicase
MLSATPINLSNGDLRIILGLLDPDEYGAMTNDNWNFFKGPNVFISRLLTEINQRISLLENGYVKIGPKVLLEAHKINDRIIKSNLWGGNYSENHPLTIAINTIINCKPDSEIDKDELLNLLRTLQRCNIFYQSITRTLKRDVSEFNERRITSVVIKLNGTESIKFKESIKKIQAYFKKNKNNKLAAQTLLRQLVSCMPLFNTDNIDNAADIEEDRFEDNNQPENAPENSVYVDSKYQKLKEILDSVSRTDNVNFKVVVFCIYRKTIEYLVSRINLDFGAGTAVSLSGQISNLSDRTKIIDDFWNKQKPNILVCSEVASEGIDLQNARVLINYDLPWNPTKVEQRIGRIDRFGQKSRIIDIFNLVIDGTIEQTIYDRLKLRLDDTRNTLGPVADILGQIESELPDYFLKGLIDEKELQKIERKIKLNFEQAKKNEQDIENESFNHSVMDHKSLIDKYSIEKYIVDHEQKVAAKVLSLSSKWLTQISKENELFLKPTSLGKTQLLPILRNDLLSIDSKERINYLFPLLESGELKIVLNHDDSLRSTADFLNSSHPIIQSIVKISQNTDVGKNINIFESKSVNLSIGIYIIIEYECQIMVNTMQYDSCYFQSAFVKNYDKWESVIDINLMTSLFDFSEWISFSGVKPSFEFPIEVEEAARAAASKHFDIQYHKILDKLKDDFASKKDMINQNYAKEYGNLENTLERTVNPIDRENIKQRISDLKTATERKMASIPSEDNVIFSPNLILCSIIEKR